MSSDFLLFNGAGYTKNWGAWLAGELWSVIISHSLVQDNQDLKNIIWKYRDLGFEEIFSDQEIKKYEKNFQKVIIDVFKEMHEALKTYNNGTNQLTPLTQDQKFYMNFLHHFKAIFSLNQDTFFEELQVGGGRKIVSYYHPHLETYKVKLEASIPQSNSFIRQPTKIPYYKLHGSINFINDDGSGLMVMGTSKPEQIGKIPILQKYHEDFEKKFLSLTNVRIMIVGYSFLDHHINKLIFDAVEKYNLKFWIIDTSNLNQLMENCAQAEWRDGNSSNSYYEENSVAIKTYDSLSKDEKFEIIKNKYDYLFREGLISHTKYSLYNIFNGNNLELNRIGDQFFR